MISTLEVIEHIVDTDGFLRRAFDALSPGCWVVPTVIHHVRIYNAAVLGQQLEATDFEQIHLRGVALLPFSMGLGRTRSREILADTFPTQCSNIIVMKASIWRAAET